MAEWIVDAAGPGGIPLALVYLELVLALTLLSTGLGFRRLAETRGDLRAARLYFAAVFVLFLALPVGLVLATAADPGATLAGFGWAAPKTGWGLSLMPLLLPVAVLAGLSGARDPAMRRAYPLAASACDGRGRFAGYELSYVLLYYLPWESVFRGALFFPLIPAVGLVPALAVQTSVATLLHIGQPDKEIVAAAVSGPLFGLLAYSTGSFLCPLVLHATAGVVADTALCRRRRREPR
ncbi:MAG: CPBP family intramembrane metalloprotease [Acidobacteria bacterium]|nr:CPBP family intramembrane metalloprotease [Acidobacteriota bacterium]